MKDSHLEPARSVIGKLGVETVATVTGKHVSRVYRWMYPKSRGGTGGHIPPEDAAAILDHARQEAIDLTPADFFLSEQTIFTAPPKEAAKR